MLQASSKNVVKRQRNVCTTFQNLQNSSKLNVYEKYDLLIQRRYPESGFDSKGSIANVSYLKESLKFLFVQFGQPVRLQIGPGVYILFYKFSFSNWRKYL